MESTVTEPFAPTCVLCKAPADGDPTNFGRDVYFDCEGGHEFVVQTAVTSILSETSPESLKEIGLQCLKRKDDFIAHISNNEGRPFVELVPRSNWPK